LPQNSGHIRPMVIYDHILGILEAVGVTFPNGKGIDRLFLRRGRKKKTPHAYGLTMPSFRMRARNVLRSSPRSSAAPFFPLTFQ